jgi:DNA polymerase
MASEMDRENLARRLAFYRDLGIKSIWAGSIAANSPAVETPVEPPVEPVAKAVPLVASVEVLHPNEVIRMIPPIVPDNDNLERIIQDMGDCTRCRLSRGRNRIVFGSGNPEARLVFVGEGPGADEDEQGIPFVGRAGQLLTQMIDNTAAKEGIAIRRENVYICNVVKCRPPENRAPEADEMEICGQFLYRQLMVIRPKAIVALGGTATKALLDVKLGITKLRGNWHKWRDIPVMPTYHPSYLLRPYNQNAKREAWEDLKLVLHYVYD